MLRRASTSARPGHARTSPALRTLVARCAGPSPNAVSAVGQLQPQRVFAPNDDTGGQLEADVLTVPGSRVFTVSLKKPLGLVLTERGSRVVVESVNAGGHAAAAGVAAGDVLLATTARAQVTSGGSAFRSQLVLLSTSGEKFSIVTAAIRSNTCSQCSVHLVLERPVHGAGPAAE